MTSKGKFYFCPFILLLSFACLFSCFGVRDLFKVYIFLMFIFEGERTHMGEGQRERETQNWKQVLGSELSAQSPAWSSNSRAMSSRPEPKSDA